MKADEPGTVEIVTNGKATKQELGKIIKDAKEATGDSSGKILSTVKDAAKTQSDNKNKEDIKKVMMDGVASAEEAKKGLQEVRDQADKVVQEAKAEAKTTKSDTAASTA